MSKKNKKSGGKTTRPHTGGRGVSVKGKNDALALMTNENVLIGAGTAVAGALIVDAIGSKFVPNIHARNAMKAFIPALAVSTLVKNPLATMVAAGVGLALGIGSYAESLVKKSIPQTTGTPNTFAGTAGFMGENVYAQTAGAKLPPPQTEQAKTIEMTPDVNGRYEAVYNVNGNFVGRVFIPDDGQEDVSGTLEGGQEEEEEIVSGNYFRDEV